LEDVSAGLLNTQYTSSQACPAWKTFRACENAEFVSAARQETGARVLLISGSMQVLKLVGIINQMLKACQFGQIAKILCSRQASTWFGNQSLGQLTKASNAARKATATLRRSPVAGTSGDLSTKAGGEFRNFEQKTPDKMWPQRNSRHL